MKFNQTCFEKNKMEGKNAYKWMRKFNKYKSSSTDAF